MINKIDRHEIENRLGYHPANSGTIELHKTIRNSFINLAGVIVDTVPEGREKALALTALQEASMWCNAGIACNLAPLDRSELTDSTEL